MNNVNRSGAHAFVTLPQENSCLSVGPAESAIQVDQAQGTVPNTLLILGEAHGPACLTRHPRIRCTGR